MPVKRIKAAKSAVINSLDINGDGVVDHRDAIVAAKLVGATAAGAGTTAFVSAQAGSAIVAAGATAIATKVTAIAGAAAGAFVAAVVGTTTTTVSVLSVGPAGLCLGTATVTKAVSAKILLMSASHGATLAKVGNKTLAGWPIIKKIALKKAIASGKVIVIGGTPVSVSVALSTGLIAIVVVGGYAYYLLTKDRVNDEENPTPLPRLWSNGPNRRPTQPTSGNLSVSVHPLASNPGAPAKPSSDI